MNSIWFAQWIHSCFYWCFVFIVIIMTQRGIDAVAIIFSLFRVAYLHLLYYGLPRWLFMHLYFVGVNMCWLCCLHGVTMNDCYVFWCGLYCPTRVIIILFLIVLLCIMPCLCLHTKPFVVPSVWFYWFISFSWGLLHGGPCWVKDIFVCGILCPHTVMLSRRVYF